MQQLNNGGDVSLELDEEEDQRFRYNKTSGLKRMIVAIPTITLIVLSF